MKTFTLSLVTPERKLFEALVVSATFSTEAGEITILADHIPYVASLKSGEMFVKDSSGEELRLAVLGGFAEFHDNTLSILADGAEHAHEIDVDRAERAVRRAEEIRSKKMDISREEHELAVAALERAWARLRVARKHRTHSGMHPKANE